MKLSRRSIFRLFGMGTAAVASGSAMAKSQDPLWLLWASRDDRLWSDGYHRIFGQLDGERVEVITAKRWAEIHPNARRELVERLIAHDPILDVAYFRAS